MLCLLALLLLLPVLANAQAGGRAPDLWPRSFSGQPDFEFDKAEVLQERTREATGAGLKPPQVPTLLNLLEDEKVSLVPVQPVSATVAGEPAASAEAPATVATAASALASLPLLAAGEKLDLGEFRTALQHRSRQTVAAFSPPLENYSMAHLLQGLLLQAVVTSPQTYAVINGTTYRVGDRFRFPLRLGPNDLELLAALEAMLPPPGSLPEALAAQYREVYEQEIARLAALRAARAPELSREFQIPVTVVAIAPRKVVLDLNGQRHELVIRYSY